MKVSELMKTRVVSLGADATIGDAMQAISDHGVRHIPILRDDRVIGVVTDRDLRPIEGEIATTVGSPNAPTTSPLERPVTELLFGDPVTVGPELLVDDLIDQLLQAHVSAAVVIDPQGHLRGMVSYVDILRAAKGKLG